MQTGVIILAGGKGRRLGREKAWIEMGGKSLLQIAVSNLEFAGSKIIIVKAPGMELPPVSAGADLTAVDDLAGGLGPVMGILTGLTHSACHYNLVTACDMPLVERELVGYLIEQAAGYDAVVTVRQGRTEPLLAIYSKGCICELKAMLNEGITRIEPLFGRVRTRYIEPEEIERYDPGYRSFFNLNTPEDLEKIESLVRKNGTVFQRV